MSQAASSLIELIDRLLRAAFTDQETLAWIAQYYPRAKGMTYENRLGAVRPTKRAQALCFSYAGMPVKERSVFHEMVAACLVAVREQLQGLKHADTGAPGDIERLQNLLAAVEGFLACVLGLGWTMAPSEAADRLRSSLEPKQQAS